MTKPTDPPGTPSDSEGYFLEIESHFAFRRGTPFIFSAKDWGLMKGWKDEGIPLAVVIEAIDQCFDKKAESGRRGVISSLSYCRHAVKAIWAERRDLLVGADRTVPESDPAVRLAHLGEKLLEAAAQLTGDARDLMAETAASVVQLAKGRSVPAIEEELMKIEQELFENLAATLSVQERAALDAEVDAALSPYRSLEGETLRKTREANFRRLLRSRMNVQRLSLFG